MCFGGKNERSDDPPPRPAQNYQSQNQGGDYNKMTNLGSNNPYGNNGGGSAGYPSQNQYAGGSSSNYYGGGPSGQQQQDQYAPPPGPPPTHNQHQQDQYAPPPGPPPSHSPQPPQQRQDDYAPPPGPPPSHSQQDYAPPPGPPPSHGQQSQDQYAPPPGPPPSQSNNSWMAPPKDGEPQPPQHNWEAAVPDTSLFPPPPAIFSGYYESHAHNSTEAEAEAGEEWCEQYPLTQPINLDGPGSDALRSHNYRLIEPQGFDGKLNWLGPGNWEVKTNRKALDRTLISYPPLYVVSQHDPTRFGRTKTVYYEVKIRRSSSTVNIAMGFSALPYPSFRLPGWHRGSLAVHGDDGHKYINDRWGGKDFTNEFRKGETYGLGMRFSPSRSGEAHKAHVQILFTRNGIETGSWNLHEETDADEDLPVTGLEGFHDLCCSIGSFEGTDFEVVFDPSKWMYQGIEKE